MSAPSWTKGSESATMGGGADAMGGKAGQPVMSCKSCRKRKIKCNRVLPSCANCIEFKMECVYDAVPKKRGPKTEIMEQLLKRFERVEQLMGGGAVHSGGESSTTGAGDVKATGGSKGISEVNEKLKQLTTSLEQRQIAQPRRPILQSTPSTQSAPSPLAVVDLDQQTEQYLVDVYFAHIHAKPFGFLSPHPQRRPQALTLAICAAASHFIASTRLLQPPHPIPASLTLLTQARQSLGMDIDNPSLSVIQTLLVLSQTAYGLGMGPKTAVWVDIAVRHGIFLSYHTNPPSDDATRAYWTGVVLERLLGVEGLRMPAVPDDVVRHGPPEIQGVDRRLCEIVGILGMGVAYALAGGVKGDSHFPWHAQSRLHAIRSALDVFRAKFDEDLVLTPSAAPEPGPVSYEGQMVGDMQYSYNIPFSLPAAVARATWSEDGARAKLGRPDGPSWLLVRVVWHVVHILLYRDFLPLEAPPSTAQGGLGYNAQQAWQADAVTTCLEHADHIVDICTAATEAGTVWPAFVGYAVFVAGLVHTHTLYYPDKASAAQGHIVREVQWLEKVRERWAGMGHLCEVMRAIYKAHGQLVRQRKGMGTGFGFSGFWERYEGVGGVGWEKGMVSMTEVGREVEADEVFDEDAEGEEVEDEGMVTPMPGMPGLHRTMTGSSAVSMYSNTGSIYGGEEGRSISSASGNKRRRASHESQYPSQSLSPTAGFASITVPQPTMNERLMNPFGSFASTPSPDLPVPEGHIPSQSPTGFLQSLYGVEGLGGTDLNGMELMHPSEDFSIQSEGEMEELQGRMDEAALTDEQLGAWMSGETWR
ncbi:hypothetical protein SAICODRAFT_23857 [Saitoella complicata NRRL Y-17804]|uniref:Zn(2)-C6 fungal-type domain-containing protein n=1 Tax=Saitoella complicata (strain BCRC 22490 / CBS 7301 / JCM 7358 / NBRC 10748 / NRRL Y-17804) TaxID=698492 RepID=A0A0E9NFB0_SAICN|nr:uncharacterized protein SAICODRAFT_23857 [Saitoella complicata NRRL Y-17804]ODQ54586.1 hypothetical protein SAICODRAFT_23857 [Saitoella complicata NRRL Y-17804]GAO48095.1 hypothetical protein G7K_2282-t1 [Saitoella complicata NRRL Y-17804]